MTQISPKPCCFRSSLGLPCDFVSEWPLGLLGSMPKLISKEVRKMTFKPFTQICSSLQFSHVAVLKKKKSFLFKIPDGRVALYHLNNFPCKSSKSSPILPEADGDSNLFTVENYLAILGSFLSSSHLHPSNTSLSFPKDLL